MEAIFSDIKYKDLVQLFNNLSKFTFNTYKLVTGELSYDTYKLRCRSILETMQSSRAIDVLDPRDYKNISANDNSIFIRVLHTDSFVRVHIIFDLNATYEYPVTSYVIPKIFNDSNTDIIILADNRIIENNINSLENILYMESIIYNILFKLTDSKFSKVATAISKLFCHVLFNYEDDWIAISKHKYFVEKCLSNKNSTPILFNYETDDNFIYCIEELCLPHIVHT